VELDDVGSEIQRCCSVIGPSVVLQVLNSVLLTSARPQLVLRRMGSASAAARMLSHMDSGGALMELMFNPMLGRASDAYGRSPFLPFAALVSTASRFFVAARGGLIALCLDKLVTSASDSMYFTVWRAALADLMARGGDSVAFATHMARIGTYAGVAAIIAPLVGDRVRRASGERACFALAGAVALVNYVWLVCWFRETLPPSERRVAGGGVFQALRDNSPFSFTQLFRRSPQLAWLFSAVGLQTVTEGRCLGSVNYLLLKNDFGWSEPAVAKAMAGLGVGLVLGGLTVKRSISSLGLRGHTTMANMVNTFVCLLWGGAGVIQRRTGISTAVTMTVALTILVPGTRKRDGLEGLVLHIGSEAGFGRGFISGALMNWRAMFNIVVPLVLGHAYAWGKIRGRDAPYAPFVLAATALVCSEACVRALSNTDLLLDHDGRPLKRGNVESREERERVSASPRANRGEARPLGRP